jgi:hypothetical protein
MAELAKPKTPKKSAVVPSSIGINQNTKTCSTCGSLLKISSRNYNSLYGKGKLYLKVENVTGVKLDRSLLEDGICCRPCTKKYDMVLSTRREITDYLSRNGRHKRVENFTPEKTEMKKTKAVLDIAPKSINFDDNTLSNTPAARFMQVSKIDHYLGSQY